MPCQEAQDRFSEWSKILNERLFYHPNNVAKHGETNSRAKDRRRELQAKSEAMIEAAQKHRASCAACIAEKREERELLRRLDLVATT